MPQYEELPLQPWQIEREQWMFRQFTRAGFAALATCDIEIYQGFCAELLAARKRPPSLYAYVARCIGEVLRDRKPLVGTRWGKSLLIPSQIDVLAMVEMPAYRGAFSVSPVYLTDVGKRDLSDIAAQLKKDTPGVKREKPYVEPRSRFAPSWAPEWWSDAIKWARKRIKGQPLIQTQARAHVQLSSTTQWLQGRTAWGFRLYTICPIAINVAGMSKRALVIHDEIVARTCLDIGFNFDHSVLDGAPATRFIADLMAEIESGRLLGEYQSTFLKEPAVNED